MRPSKITCVCLYCKSEFDVPPCVIRIQEGKFCSLECYRKSKGTPEDRFWAKVNKSGPSIIETPCWVWTAMTTQTGYGVFKERDGFPIKAHRFSWILHFGKIPQETPHVCHTCDNPPCVNPEHLFLGTHKDNMADAVSKGHFRRGSSQPFSKLKEADIPIIREMAERKMKLREIADIFGVSDTCIGAVARGDSWKHIP